MNTSNSADFPHGSPKLVLVFSGKRKSGKDFITEKLLNKFGDTDCTLIRLSGPLKHQYAKEHGLDYNRLLDATEYKETFRSKMILWGEEIRRKDPSYFCRHAILQSNAVSNPIWIVSDARRKTDIDFFCNEYSTATRTVRVCASNETRSARGWVFTKGVDDAESECGLDDYTDWDFTINNDVAFDDSVIAALLATVKKVL